MTEVVLCAVPVRKVKLLGMPESFALVVTNQRTILIPLTSEMLKKAVIDARDEAAAEGKGMMGKWTAQMKASLGYTSRYLAMEPDEILRQNPKHQVLGNDSLTKVRIRMRQDVNRNMTLWYLTMQSPAGKTKYELQSRTKDLVNALKQAYGNRFKG
ncbi:hypothetical protein JW848_03735 [Candidatus Bipolaricaulota bacterium]|nr:hypothetical protein [Candidatus Bipolaricaulota bacterium]